MPHLADNNRELWLWLKDAPGAYTADELAAATGRDYEELRWHLYKMAKLGTVETRDALPESRRARYAVTGNCRIPLGMHVAEVQA